MCCVGSQGYCRLREQRHVGPLLFEYLNHLVLMNTHYPGYPGIYKTLKQKHRVLTILQGTSASRLEEYTPSSLVAVVPPDNIDSVGSVTVYTQYTWVDNTKKHGQLSLHTLDEPCVSSWAAAGLL